MMSFSWFRHVARSLNHSRPWWWRGLVHTLKADRWAWWVEPGNKVHLHPRAPWLDLTLRGQGHRVVVEPGATLRGVVLDIVGAGLRAQPGLHPHPRQGKSPGDGGKRALHPRWRNLAGRRR